MERLSSLYADAKNVFWSAIGSVLNSIVSLILVVIITMIFSGDTIPGQFAICFTTAQILLSLGLYGVRNYQVTDLSHMIPDGIYIGTRILTNIMMLVIGLLYAFASGYSTDKTLLVVLLVGSKMAESMSDVYYGFLQKHGKLYIAGISMTVRSILSFASFAAVLVLSHNLIWASFSLFAASCLPLFAIDLPSARKLGTIKPDFKWDEIFSILKTCFPLFVISILGIIIVNMPKYIIDFTLTDNEQAVYNYIVTPGTTIGVFTQVMIQAFLVKLSHYFKSDNHKYFVRLLIFLGIGITAFTLICIIIFSIWGAPILYAVYHRNLSSYVPLLLIVFLGALFANIAGILSAALTTIRITRTQLYLYLVNLALALVVSITLIPRYGIRGAVYSYLVSMLCQMALYAVVAFRNFGRSSFNNLA